MDLGHVSLHVGEAALDRHPVARRGVEPLGLHLLPAVVEDHRLHADLGRQLRLRLQLVRVHVLQERVPRRVERIERRLGGVRRLEAVLLRHPPRAGRDRLGPVASAPVEHDLRDVLLPRDGRPREELATADHVARALLGVESEDHVLHRLAAGDGDGRDARRVEANDEWRFVRELGVVRRLPAPPQTRPEMGTVRLMVARPDVLHARAGHAEEHAELRRSGVVRPREAHRHHVAVVIHRCGDVEDPAPRVTTGDLGRPRKRRLNRLDDGRLLVHYVREQRHQARHENKCHAPLFDSLEHFFKPHGRKGTLSLRAYFAFNSSSLRGTETIALYRSSVSTKTI